MRWNCNMIAFPPLTLSPNQANKHPIRFDRVLIGLIRTPKYIGGSRGRARHMPPPLRDQILSFSHTFLPKSTHVRGPHPP